MKIVIYRNIAVLGAIALVLNTIFFSQVEKLNYISQVIDLIASPLTITSTALWLNKRIVIIALAIFLFGFTIELTAKYSELLDQFNTLSLSKFHTAFSVTGLLLALFALMSKKENGWLMKRTEKTELYTALTLLMVPTVVLGLIYTLFAN